jgi:hypothetical protein
MRITTTNILGIEFRRTLREGFWYRCGRWRLCNIESTNAKQWKRRRRTTDGRSWGQINIDLRALDDEKIIEQKL